MSCEHDCKKPPIFPARVFNRPALEHIGYSVGDYGRLREYLLDRLDKTVALAAWTHRGADDPGIAILEAAAEAGDILTFYQTLYANEAFLRTARWRESVAGLVQLCGYRLAPGIGGEATFAVAVGGEEPVVVPLGFGFKAQLAGQEKPAEFESTAEVTAYPALSEFHLYRPRLGMANIANGLTRLELHAVDGQVDLTSLEGVELAEGDRVMLVPDTAVYDAGGGAYDTTSPQKKPEILIVKEVETVLDRIVVTFEGALTVDRGTTVKAYKIDRTFRHFGHTAPRTIGQIDETAGSYTSIDTDFVREIWGHHTPASAVASYYSKLRVDEMPLDVEVDDLAVGGKLICEGRMEFDGISSPVRFSVVKTIEDLRADTLVWGNMTGSSTVLTVDSKLIANGAILNEKADLRQIRFHETIGSELTLRAPSAWANGAFTNGVLTFFGTWAEARSLARRDLMLTSSAGTAQTARVTEEVTDFSLAGKDETNRWRWPVTLDQLPLFERQAFDEAEPEVTVYGNLVPTDQGKTETEAVLGSGDRRQTFQTFAVPKAPLTYLLDDARTPPQVPELDVYVDATLWQRLDTFFASGPDDRVYVVREDDEGKSYVQFGDGKTGSRLTSGRNNVTARYRTGTAAAGRLETDAKPSATGKLKPLEEVFMPASAVGGGEAETRDNARTAAPGALQSLGRLVSLADIEAEALALPGVVKARAHRQLAGGVPQVAVTVLTESDEGAAIDKVRASLRTANRCRGPARFPIAVVQGMRRYVYVALRAGYEASQRAADVELAIRQALGLGGETSEGEESEGLFTLARRQFGGDVHLSQILGAVQQADGVTWVAADAAQPLGAGGSDPTALAKPVPAVLEDVLGCAADHVLALHTAHFDLNLSIDQAAEGCGA